MALAVVGSGFGRTGTRSLKDALEILGFGPCHHMSVVFQNPELVDAWVGLARGEPQDWKTYFAGYRSQVDWPGAHVWRELLAAFPEAKVVHSVRPEDSWWKSYSRTIGRLRRIHGTIDLPPHVHAMLDAIAQLVGMTTLAERDVAIAAYRKRTEEVRAAVPPDRLIIYDVAEGWQPLCAFLGVPVPETPFPRLNSGDDFWTRFGGEPAEPAVA